MFYERGRTRIVFRNVHVIDVLVIRGVRQVSMDMPVLSSKDKAYEQTAV